MFQLARSSNRLQCVKQGQNWDRAVPSMNRALYHLKERTEINLKPNTVRPVLLNRMQNLYKHQLTSVRLVVPFWLSIK